MESCEIRAIRSGFEETYAWVTLWYRAEPRRLSVLHIVVSSPDEQGSPDPVYLERQDQGFACYGGADRILVGDQGIRIQLNATGAKALGLGRTLMLTVPPKLSGWKKAGKVFKTVAGVTSKKIIRIV
jgi:hypothetical protein